MNTKVRTALLAAVAAGVVGVGTANAQLVAPIEFTTTFAFTVGDTQLSAGRYSVREVEPGLMQLMDGRVGVFFTVEVVAPPQAQPTKDEIIFNRYGDKYVLKEIWDAGGKTGLQTVASLVERRHEKAHGAPTKHAVPHTKVKPT